MQCNGYDHFFDQIYKSFVVPTKPCSSYILHVRFLRSVMHAGISQDLICTDVQYGVVTKTDVQLIAAVPHCCQGFRRTIVHPLHPFLYTYLHCSSGKTEQQNYEMLTQNCWIYRKTVAITRQVRITHPSIYFGRRIRLFG